MAEAYADDTELGCASCKVCVCKGLAEGVGEDGGSHKEDVIKELHEDRVMAKGDAPGGRLFSVDHGRHDVFWFHAAFGKGTCGNKDSMGGGVRGGKES